MNTWAPPRVGLRSATWVFCFLSTIAVLVLLRATNTVLEIGPLLAAVGGVLVLAGLHLVYTRLRPDPCIGAVSGGLATVTWAGFMAGIAALAGLRTGAPLIDAQLAHADAALHLDTAALVAWLARHPPTGRILEIAYVSAVPVVFATVVLLALTRRAVLMWELCFTFAATATVSAFACAFVPAVGAFAHYGIPLEILAEMPNGAGRFHLPTFESYRSGVLDTVDVRHLEGVVTFPSFHAAMALMTAYAVRDVRGMAGPAWIWSGVVTISTIPIGGHYAVDLVAGAAVWVAFALLARTRTAAGKQKAVSRSEGRAPPQVMVLLHKSYRPCENSASAGAQAAGYEVRGSPRRCRATLPRDLCSGDAERHPRSL